MHAGRALCSVERDLLLAAWLRTVAQLHSTHPLLGCQVLPALDLWQNQRVILPPDLVDVIWLVCGVCIEGMQLDARLRSACWLCMQL